MKYVLKMKTTIRKLKRLFCPCDVTKHFDSEVFVQPFKLGKNQKRAILDAKGREVINYAA